MNNKPKARPGATTSRGNQGLGPLWEVCIDAEVRAGRGDCRVGWGGGGSGRFGRELPRPCRSDQLVHRLLGRHLVDVPELVDHLPG